MLRGRADVGLSIVIPVYNEVGRTAGSARTDFRGRAPSQGDPSADHRSRLCRRRQPGRHACRWRTRLARRSARRPGRVAVAQFRQGGRAARRPRSCPLRGRAVHGRRRPAPAVAGRDNWSRIGSTTATTSIYTAKAHRENEPRLRRLGVRLLLDDQLGRAAEDSGGRRRLPPVVAARRGSAQATAGTQPLLQGAGELDRIPPEARRLRAGGARARHEQLEFCIRCSACRSKD